LPGNDCAGSEYQVAGPKKDSNLTNFASLSIHWENNWTQQFTYDFDGFRIRWKMAVKRLGMTWRFCSFVVDCIIYLITYWKSNTKKKAWHKSRGIIRQASRTFEERHH